MGQRMMLLRPIHEYIDNKFILYSIMSPESQKRMVKNSVGTGVKHLRVGDVESFALKICSLEEQKQIVHRVESLFTLANSVEKQYQQARQRTDKLTQSLLAKAFRGELVPQDPNDEPAEKLLARIQAEREKMKPKKTRKKSR